MLATQAATHATWLMASCPIVMGPIVMGLLHVGQSDLAQGLVMPFGN